LEQFAKPLHAKARSWYENLLAIEPNDPAVLREFADYLLGMSRIRHAFPAGKVLQATELKSEGGATLTQLPDGSVLAGGKRPAADVYTIRAQANIQGAQVLRLEALPDASLPDRGPGRGNNGSFLLTELAVEKAGRSIPLQAVAASYSQPGF